jgi:hypothetical protein
MNLNIISRTIRREHGFGAAKVGQNTLKGLEKIGVNISINGSISDYLHNWIHDSRDGVIEAGLSGKPVLIGPNVAVTPSDLPRFRKHLHASTVFLFPSAWPMRAWQAVGFKECELRVWSAGIESHPFNKRRRVAKDPNHLLIYFKHRDPKLLTRVINLVSTCGYTFDLYAYGHYKQKDYERDLLKAKCGIWIGGTESQGFALMEALASGLPLIVLDVNSLNENLIDPSSHLTTKFSPIFVASGATSAPYFDKKCGLKISATQLNEEILNDFLNNIDIFDPAAYINDKHSLEHSAHHLVTIAKSLPDSDTSSNTPFQSEISKILSYADLATRKWPWKLLARKLVNHSRRSLRD